MTMTNYSITLSKDERDEVDFIALDNGAYVLRCDVERPLQNEYDAAKRDAAYATGYEVDEKLRRFCEGEARKRRRYAGDGFTGGTAGRVRVVGKCVAAFLSTGDRTRGDAG